MSSSDNAHLQTLTILSTYLHQYVCTIFYVIGNIGNLLSLVIFFKRSWRKNVCVFYFTISLLINTIFVNSALLGAIFIHGFNIKAENSNVLLCKLLYYISYFCSSYLPIILILASIDRLLISSQNVDRRLYSSKRLAYFTISTSAFLWITFCLHILIKVDIQQFGPTYYACYYDLSKSYLNFITYSTLVFTAILPAMMIILSVLAFKNVRQIRGIPRQKRNQVRTMKKKDFQLLRCLYIHNIVYVSCSIVLVAGVIYESTTALHSQTSTVQAVNYFLNNFGAFIHCIPYCASFFIFVCVSKAFRQELKRMTYKIGDKDVVVARGEEENQHQEEGRENVVVSTIALSH